MRHRQTKGALDHDNEILGCDAHDLNRAVAKKDAMIPGKGLNGRLMRASRYSLAIAYVVAE